MFLKPDKSSEKFLPHIFQALKNPQKTDVKNF
jgi:hypothetical protein